MSKNGGQDGNMTRNSGTWINTFTHARKGLTDAGVGRPLGLGRFSRKPSEGLYQFNRLSVHVIARARKRHSRYHGSLRDICCSSGFNANITNGCIVLLVLNAVPTRALL